MPGEALSIVLMEPTPFLKDMPEMEILNLFYNSLSSNTQTNNSNWKSSENYYYWYGVQCNDKGSIESIILINNNMKGRLATEIYLLPSLSILTLSDSIDIDIIFTRIEYANSLRLLDFSETGLKDLQNLNNTPQLIELVLVGNELEGKIPQQIFILESLEELYLENNKLSKAIYDNDIRQLKELKIFTAKGNQIMGSIPEGLEDCKLLNTLRLQGNKLAGQLSSFLQDLTDLMFLDLSNNLLEESLLSFDNDKDLCRLSLNENQLTGTIFETFLAKVDIMLFAFTTLCNNLITSTISLVIAGLQFGFQDNKISSIDPAIYNKSLDGIIVQFGSDSILCLLKTWNV